MGYHVHRESLGKTSCRGGGIGPYPPSYPTCVAFWGVGTLSR